MIPSINLEPQRASSQPRDEDLNRGLVSERRARPEQSKSYKWLYKKIFWAILIISLWLLGTYLGLQFLRKINPSVKMPAILENKLIKMENKVHNFENKVKGTVKKTIANFPHLHKKSDFSNCEECIDYEELLKNLENTTSIHYHLIERLNKVINVEFNPRKEFELDSIERFMDRISLIPEVQQKIKHLVTLNKTLSKEIYEALKMEKKYLVMQEKYDRKAQEIGSLRNQIAMNLSELQTIRDQVQLLKRSYNIVDERVKEEEREMTGARTEHDIKVKNLKEEMRERYTPQRMEDLEKDIKLKENLMVEYEMERRELEQQINNDESRLSELENIMLTYSERLLVLEPVLEGKEMIEYTKMIVQYEEIIKKIEIEKESDLLQVDKMISESLIRLENTEKELKDLLLLDYPMDHPQILERLELIELENKVLKELAQLKFTTADNAEIEKQEARLNLFQSNLDKGVKIEDFDKMIYERKLLRSQLTMIPQEIEGLKRKILETKKKLAFAEDNVFREKTILALLNQERDSLKTLKQELMWEEGAFEVREILIVDLEKDLGEKEQYLKKRIGDIESYEQSKKDEIKELTKRVNEKILEEPQFEEMQEKINEYRLKMAKVNEAYWLLQNLMEEIKKLVC
jgi:hypothetical protein